MKLGEVVFARVADDENNHRVLIQIARYPQSSSAIGAGRPAAKNPFYSSELSREIKRLAIGDVHHFVDILYLRIARQNFLADALNQVRSRFGNLSRLFVSLVNRADGIGADHSDIRISFFKKSSGAGNRAAGANARYKVSELPFSLLPQFRPRGAIVRFGIGRMRILIGIKRIRSFRSDTSRG